MQLRGSSRNAWWQPTLPSLNKIQLGDAKGELEDTRFSCIEHCDWPCQYVLYVYTCCQIELADPMYAHFGLLCISILCNVRNHCTSMSAVSIHIDVRLYV